MQDTIKNPDDFKINSNNDQWDNFLQYMKDENLDFFTYNERIGKEYEKIEELILRCVQFNHSDRPSAI